METEGKPEQELNPKVILITLVILILIPIVYVLFIKKDTVNEAPQPPAQAQQQARDTAASQTNNTEQLKTAVKTNPTEANYINLSLTYFGAKQYHQCIDASRKAIAINPKSLIAYNNICCAYNSLGIWDSAIVAGRAALAIDPNYQLAKNNLNWALQMKGKKN